MYSAAGIRQPETGQRGRDKGNLRERTVLLLYKMENITKNGFFHKKALHPLPKHAIILTVQSVGFYTIICMEHGETRDGFFFPGERQYAKTEEVRRYFA